MDIDWQNDINLFEKPMYSIPYLLLERLIPPSRTNKHKKLWISSQVHWFITNRIEMLLEEIKKDLFPKRGVEPVAT